MEPTFVWVLTSGSDSDYQVVGVYSSEKNAMKAFALERDVNTPFQILVDETIERLYWWRLTMFKDGSIRQFRRGNDIEFLGLDYDGPTYDEITLESDYDDFPPSISCCIQAKSERHAIKICNEKRLRAIAEGRFEKPGATGNTRKSRTKTKPPIS